MVPQESQLIKNSKLFPSCKTYTTNVTIQNGTLYFPGIPKEQLDLFKDNSQDLKNFQFVTKDSGKIIDKIPYKDENTGELKWRIVRETEKAEGWEFPYFYLVLPIFAYVAYSKYTAQMARRANDGPEWAEKELRLRAMEDYFRGDTEKAKEFLVTKESLQEKSEIEMIWLLPES